MTEFDFDISPQVVRFRLSDSHSFEVDPVEAFFEMHSVLEKIWEGVDEEIGLTDRQVAQALREWIMKRYGVSMTDQQIMNFQAKLNMVYPEFKKKLREWPTSVSPSKSIPESWTPIPSESSPAT